MFTELHSLLEPNLCEREQRNRHSDWAIAVKKPGSREVAGYVPDDLAQVLFPLLTSEKNTVHDV